MPGTTARDLVDDVIRDLDLVVFRLERPLADPSTAEAERRAIRKELERLRERLELAAGGIT
jgi:hypothetical protein